MIRILFTTSLLLGSIAVIWMAQTFVGTDTPAFTVTAVIGGVYTIGIIELLQFRHATSTLEKALHSLPEKVTAVDEWLQKLDDSLCNPVRLRLEGNQTGLPSPVLTPYLVGLLVMLGLLGTFVGMVVTLKGAVIALEGTTEIQAIRAGLAAPIKGLGMAFGTSVAGVATSAMLGLMATLCRQDRILVVRRLDAMTSTAFRDFSLAHDQRETFKALRIQSDALPEVAEKLQIMADQLERMGENLGRKLIENQESFHASARQIYSELADSVDKTLKERLSENVRLAGESIQPIVQQAMAGITTETQKVHQQITMKTQKDLRTLSGLFKDNAKAVSQAWQIGLTAHDQANAALIERLKTALDSYSGQFDRLTGAMLQSLNNTATSWIDRQTERDLEVTAQFKATVEHLSKNTENTSSQIVKEIAGLLQSSEALVQTRIQSEADWLENHGKRMDNLTVTIKDQLIALREDEARRSQAAIVNLAGLEGAFASHLAELNETLNREIETPMRRLIQTASEAPRAAAEVIEQLRREISKSIERDNSMLEERQRIMLELETLSDSLTQTATEQRKGIEQLVESSERMLQDVGERFNQQVDSEVSNFSKIADNFAGSAVEMASLGDAFGTAVNLFNESNLNLIENLTRIEASLANANSRSDEQLGYYVAQAREIIDHSMLSQKEIFEELRSIRQNAPPSRTRRTNGRA